MPQNNMQRNYGLPDSLRIDSISADDFDKYFPMDKHPVLRTAAGNYQAMRKEGKIDEYREAILRSAKAFNVDPAEIVGLIMKETSGGRNIKTTGTELSGGPAQVSVAAMQEILKDKDSRRIIEEELGYKINRKNYTNPNENIALTAANLKRIQGRLPDAPRAEHYSAYNMGVGGYKKNKRNNPGSIERNVMGYGAPIFYGASLVRRDYPEFDIRNKQQPLATQKENVRPFDYIVKQTNDGDYFQNIVEGYKRKPLPILPSIDMYIDNQYK